MTADPRATLPAANEPALPALEASRAREDALLLLARVSGWLADVALGSVIRDEVDDAA